MLTRYSGLVRAWSSRWIDRAADDEDYDRVNNPGHSSQSREFVASDENVTGEKLEILCCRDHKTQSAQRMCSVYRYIMTTWVSLGTTGKYRPQSSIISAR